MAAKFGAKTQTKSREMQVSVARYLRTPPYAARRKDLVSATRTAYAARAIAGARLSFAIVLFSPVTVADSRDKANPFRRSSILFRPHDPQTKDVGGAAGYRPRVRSAYYERVYVHSPRRNTLEVSEPGRSFNAKARGILRALHHVEKSQVACRSRPCSAPAFCSRFHDRSGKAFGVGLQLGQA